MKKGALLTIISTLSFLGGMFWPVKVWATVCNCNVKCVPRAMDYICSCPCPSEDTLPPGVALNNSTIEWPVMFLTLIVMIGILFAVYQMVKNRKKNEK